MYIERIRFIVRRTRDYAIMCGFEGEFEFLKEREVRATTIKTYPNEETAYATAKSAFGYEDSEIFIEKVYEVISTR